MKKIAMLIIGIAILFSSVDAANRMSKKEREKLGGVESDKYPFVPAEINVPPFVKENRFKMSLEPREHDIVQAKLDRFTRIMNSTYGLELLQKPVLKPIMTIDMLYLHPEYLSSIILPEGSVISYVKPSFETVTKVQYDQNVLNVKPNRDFLNGNIAIFYKKDKKNYHLNIIVKNYREASCTLSKEKELLMCEDSGFGLVYSYYDEKQYDISNIFFAYLKLVNNSLKEIEKYGFAKVIYKGSMFRIEKDNKFGDIFYGGNRYMVTPV